MTWISLWSRTVAGNDGSSADNPTLGAVLWGRCSLQIHRSKKENYGPRRKCCLVLPNRSLFAGFRCAEKQKLWRPSGKATTLPTLRNC
jgi:hypothetical protein